MALRHWLRRVTRRKARKQRSRTRTRKRIPTKTKIKIKIKTKLRIKIKISPTPKKKSHPQSISIWKTSVSAFLRFRCPRGTTTVYSPERQEFFSWKKDRRSIRLTCKTVDRH